jgi:hypothetical protein
LQLSSFADEEKRRRPSCPLQPTHHGPWLPLTAPTSGNHCSPQPSTDFSNKVCRKRIWWTVIKRFLRASAIADAGSKSLG